MEDRSRLAIAYGCGLRMKELRAVKKIDVDEQRMQVHMRNGKGVKNAIFTFPDLITTLV